MYLLVFRMCFFEVIVWGVFFFVGVVDVILVKKKNDECIFKVICKKIKYVFGNKVV